MKVRTLLAAFVVGLAVMLVGCRTAPVMNIDGAGITANVKSMSDVKSAIIRAGAALGWAMKPVSQGHIVGTLRIRKHMAKVDIKYNKKTYSITYKDSSNLNYEATGGDTNSGPVIHSNYNGWIQNLDAGIQNQLAIL